MGSLHQGIPDRLPEEPPPATKEASVAYAVSLLEQQRDKFQELAILCSQQLGDDATQNSLNFLYKVETLKTALAAIHSMHYDLIGLKSALRRDVQKHGDCRSCEWRGRGGVYGALDF